MYDFMSVLRLGVQQRNRFLANCYLCVDCKLSFEIPDGCPITNDSIVMNFAIYLTVISALVLVAAEMSWINHRQAATDLTQVFDSCYVFIPFCHGE